MNKNSSLKAVISVLNSKYIHSSLAPWCLIAGIKQFGNSNIDAQIIEGTINESLSDVASRIVKANPQVLGLCCYIWNISKTLELVKLVKEILPDCVIVLGGPEVSYNPDVVLARNPLVNFIISGEGEQPFALLLNAICGNNLRISEISGICYRENGKIVISSPNTPTEEPPSPYCSEYFDSLNGRIAYLETSRGCPYTCAFCLSGRCGNVRFFDIDRAKNDMLDLANSGTKTIKLIDRTFNANRKRAFELFQFIIDNYGLKIPSDVCFHFEIAGDILDEQTIKLLSTAPIGSIQLEIGLQSFNPKTLSAVHRKTDIAKLYRNIQQLINPQNIHIHIDLIAGLPFEDWSSFRDSFNMAYALNPNMLQMGFLKLLNGADMRECPEEFPCQYSKEPPYEVINTPWLAEEELNQLHHVEDALERIYNSGRFSRTIQYIVQNTEQTPFDIFYAFGKYMKNISTAKIPLDTYIQHLSGYFSSINSLDKAKLRDVMTIDYISTNSSGRLPLVLQVKDPNLKEAKIFLDSNPITKSKSGVKRGMALIYCENSIIYADYEPMSKNPVTGEYPINKIPFENI